MARVAGQQKIRLPPQDSNIGKDQHKQNNIRQPWQ